MLDILRKAKPLSDWVVVLPDKRATETATGIALPESTDDDLSSGEVIAVGEGRYSEYTGKRLPMETEVGDKVIYRKHAGEDICIDEDGKIYGGHEEGKDAARLLIQDSILLVL